MQHVSTVLGNTPVLVADHIGEVFEKGDGRKRVIEATFKLFPVTAVQVLSDEDAIVSEVWEVSGKRLHYITGTV